MSEIYKKINDTTVETTPVLRPIVKTETLDDLHNELARAKKNVLRIEGKIQAFKELGIKTVEEVASAEVINP